MNPMINSLCEQFIQSRDTIKQTLKMSGTYIYPVCANLFCGTGKTAEREQLEVCKKLLASKTSAFSTFRGAVHALTVCMLSLENAPEEKISKVLNCYQHLKKEFLSSPALAMAAFFVPDDGDISEKAVRAKTLYRRMRDEHPFLTSSDDAFFAVLMAFSPKTDDQLIEDMEECYQQLKARFGASNNIQTTAHVLALGEGDPAKKTGKMLELFDAIAQTGLKYGKLYELPVLASLSMIAPNARQASADLLEADEFLSKQKGYGFWGMGKKMRLMHAAMILSGMYSGQSHMNAAAISCVLYILSLQRSAAAAN